MPSAIGALRRFCRRPAAPLVLLAVVSVLSLGARCLLLDEPCQSPCSEAGDHTLIFDEAYYVNAARVIAGIRPPPGAHYADAPLGTDPNAEHPQGVKLIMAASIELFGDGPFAWRIGSILMGSVAILGMFALVRSTGAGRWSALCASTLMACDNLLLVHSRIGTLDIYVVAMMICGIALYLRGHPLLAGLALAVGCCFKEVGVYALPVLALIELGHVLLRRRDRSSPAQWRLGISLARLAAASSVTIVVFLALLGIMDAIATPYADSEARLITGGPFDHLAHIISYAANLTSPHGPQGIASYPWQWLIDLQPIVYLRISASLPHAVNAIHPVVDFLGMVSPPILAPAMPALAFCLYRLARRRSPDSGRSAADQELALLGVAWFFGTWTIFEAQSALDSRTSYIYYMVVVMPGIYVAVTDLVALGWRRRNRWLSGLTALWALSVLVAVVLMYPFVALF
ncbi:MAG: phospholipid carrier-dependent glycosyltransferase [Solirubrobacteraceae bacterium]